MSVSCAHGYGRIGHVACGAVVWMICAGGAWAQNTINQVGDKTSWPTNWTAINGLNDPDDSVARERLDFVGNASFPGAYWTQDSSYVYFRVRVDAPTVDSSDFAFKDTIQIFIDYGTFDGVPDYAFAWDSAEIIDNHGLEMQILDKNLKVTDTTTWKQIKMEDIDGNAGNKGTNDINGGRTTDGYVRTTDSQPTSASDFNNTSFVDFAVSWDYLTNLQKGNTALGPGQTWKIALGSISGKTDHNVLDADVAGGATLDSYAKTTGWSGPIQTQAVPEPSSIALLGLVVVVGYAGRRLRRRRHGTTDSTDAGHLAL